MIDIKQYEDAVSRPGKFEGEPRYVPYFWDETMNSGYASETEHLCDEDHADEECENYFYYYIVEITAEDKRQFPELAGFSSIDLWESDQGFVYHKLQKS